MGDQCDLTMRVDTFNPNPGGLYRYVYTDPTGKEFAFHGVFHECLSPKLIVRTFEFEGLPEKGHVSLEKLIFTALPGDRTNVVAHSVFCSLADRDAMLHSGVIKGITDSHERLSSLIEKTTAK
jgi:uncharacterized protein YndB with AHSA1/START domain